MIQNSQPLPLLRKEKTVGKRKIGIDFDDVAVDTFTELLSFCNQQYGEQFHMEQFVAFGQDSVWNINEEACHLRFLAFDNSEARKNIRPMPGAQQVIMQLARIHELHIITARPVEIAPGTHEIIDEHFPQAFKGVHFCGSDNNPSYRRPKSLVCQEIEVALHIEDHPETAIKCVAEGIKILLFDRPWNRSAPEHQLITRVHSWNEIFKILCQP